MSARRPRDLATPVVLALLVHAGLAAGLALAGQYSRPEAPRPLSVELRLVEPPPPVVEAEPPPPPPPPEPDPPKPEPVKPPPPARIAEVTPETVPPPETPPVTAAPTPEPPAPGPPDTGAAEPYVYKMETGPGGNMGVSTGGASTGVLGGRPGGKGTTSTGGGGAPGATGTGTVATIASVKTLPRPLDSNYDHITIKESDYPEEARRRGIEGQVVVRILVDVIGQVTEVKLVKGLGHGLDEHALRVARKLRFLPARDTNDQVVATRISWSFQFQLPDDL